MKISKNFKSINTILQDTIKSQVKNTFNFQHLNQGFWNTKKFLGDKTDCYILTLTALLYYRGSRKVCYPAVSTLASFAGVTGRSIQRAIRELQADGLVAVYNPYKEGKHYRTNSYLLSNVFNLEKVKKQLFSVLKSSLSEYVTLLKEQALYIFRNKLLNQQSDWLVEPEVETDQAAVAVLIVTLKAIWEKIKKNE